MTGRCWAEPHQPLRAIPALEDALARYDDTRARDRALYLSWLAAAYLDAGEVEHATAITGGGSTAQRDWHRSERRPGHV